ncbi:hypothetical protein H5V45_08745 [Nocardioides sp. KIGAM211]|uniref:Polyketide cyclase / dehydrase and lipid transport n=1 Tax=Nocardioides luti TaxID=2761101 RepID=A0A7X0RFR8_9ACTN|nr:SRPBCC family protein [Nocardioides luti]MBB6627407.1 hypothetical protein [Nocardioides luti]
MTGLPLAWGTVGDEHTRPYPADDLVPGPVVAMTRAVAVSAPAALTWRWVCQTRLAPHSYDLVDNLGRRSPQELTPGAEVLRVGDRMAIVYELTDLEDGHSWSGVSTPSASRLLGRFATTYAVEPDGPDGRSCRLVCRLVVTRRGRAAWLTTRLLAWGDLVMMRRQLLNLKGLAERDARR